MKTNKTICLNDTMLNGPVVKNDLFDILLLFSTFEYVLFCDMKAMYRCVLVEEKYFCLQDIFLHDSPHNPIQCVQ